MAIYSPDKNDTQRSLGFLMTTIAAGALLFVAACGDEEQARKDDDGKTKVSEAPKSEPAPEFDVVLNGETSSSDQETIDFMSADEAAGYRSREAMPLMSAPGAPQAYPQPRPGDVNRERQPGTLRRFRRKPHQSSQGRSGFHLQRRRGYGVLFGHAALRQ